ncbi:translocation/assembly module TamB domain-containing protein [Histidinibacterium lentulum]|uniref:Translocation and assembly module TamB C-terminal domain-containing protein n=1 Tax=Histidinibacterium lentulum TaxID=2480588 RepID=A0A3N2R7Y0_9RHOB|nr:translocation/assembly module TamB domain-containing protein [Histidinibacterium lentulum]ROU03602.1 hypothetical protein EAT49_04715 [Histidinibacterium lentulum]
MSHLLRAFALLLLLIAPFTAAAQGRFEQAEGEDDPGYLARLLQDNLSGAGRDVRITGFRGALSSQATIERLSIADADGVWLVAEDLLLDWNRSALLRRRLDVNALSAGRIAILRPPVTEEAPRTAPSRQATPFTLPELPVSVEIDELAVERIEIGDHFIGEPVALTLNGEVALQGGEGFANITARRLDETTGEFQLAGEFSNETRILSLDLRLEEGPGGIVATRLDIPGAPALETEISGTGPLDDFAAELSLSTDGVQRIGGSFTLTAEPQPGSEAPVRVIALDVAGDVASLLAPDYGAFFGPDVSLVARVRQEPEGGIVVPELSLQAQAVTLEGSLVIAEDGWPVNFALEGALRSDGEPLLLPIGGPPTFVDGGQIFLAYDQAEGEDWSGYAFLEGFTRPGIDLPSVTIFADGVIRPDSAEDPDGFANAVLEFQATDLELDDRGLSEALGSNPAGRATLVINDGAPLKVEDVSIASAGLVLSGGAVVEQEPLALAFAVEAEAEDFGRFATLSGLEDLGGAGLIAAEGRVRPLSGIFDLGLTAQTRDLELGNERVDPLLTGESTLRLEASRDEAGTRVELFELRADQLSADGQAFAAEGVIDAEVSARLAELSVLSPELSGPGTLTATVTERDGETVTFDLALDAATADLDVTGTALASEDYAADVRIAADVAALAPFSELAGRPLSGAADLVIEGRVEPETQFFDLTAAGTTQDLGLGLPQVDPLLEGAGRLELAVARDAAGLTLSRLDIATGEVTASGSAALTEDETRAALEARIEEVGLVLDGLSGPATLVLDAEEVPGGSIDLALRLAAPAATVTADAVVAPEAQDYATTGTLEARVSSLRAFSPLAGRSLGGSVALDAAFDLRPLAGAGTVDLSARTTDLAVGIPTVDRLLRGPGTLEATVSRTEAGTVVIRALDLDLPNLTADAEATVEGATGRATFDARLADASLLAPDLSGPVTVGGSASLGASGAWRVNADVAALDGATATVSGTAGPGSALDLSVTGQAPLGLVNPFLGTQRLTGAARFDLNVGGPSLAAISGQVSVTDAQLSLPTLGQSIPDIDGSISLSGGRAQVDLTAAGPEGGVIRIGGPVGLSAPFVAALDVTVSRLVLTDPQLYSTVLDGSLGIDGPLTGGGTISGDILLGRTEVQVPSSTVGALGELPEVRHVRPEAGVRRTLERAGLTVEGVPAGDGGGGGGGGGGRGGFGLDIDIRAPSQIFVRGRGLDAELGGELTLGGTTSDVRPVGAFELRRGRLDVLQQRFDLTEGQVQLAGDFVPVLRFVAETTARDGTVVRIVLTGPASDPTLVLESEPDLPEDEVLARLLFGRNISAITPLQAVQLASAAATLAGRGGGFVGSIRESLGVDDFDLTTDESGNAAVRVGTYITENIYTDLEVNSRGETRIDLNLDITGNLTARGSVESSGETSLGVYFERDY